MRRYKSFSKSIFKSNHSAAGSVIRSCFLYPRSNYYYLYKQAPFIFTIVLLKRSDPLFKQFAECTRLVVQHLPVRFFHPVFHNKVVERYFNKLRLLPDDGRLFHPQDIQIPPALLILAATSYASPSTIALMSSVYSLVNTVSSVGSFKLSNAAFTKKIISFHFSYKALFNTFVTSGFHSSPSPVFLVFIIKMAVVLLGQLV